MASLLERVRERRLLPWMLAYLAGAWLVLRLVETFGPRFDISDAAVLGIDAILVIGFFITLVVAWYHGEPGRQQPRGMELVILTILLLIAAGVLPLLVDEPFVVPDEPEAPGQPGSLPGE